ncbi:hypothetical protein GQ54DRAFT_297453 [Martensiomyces pterosporus]|nr:hypothetical protein GQ54DRAFT_297453 [Martensiomyces pterosporus]
MIISSRLVASIAAAASLLITQASAARGAYNDAIVHSNGDGVAINSDGTIFIDGEVKDISKADLFRYLDTKESILISFYEQGKKESDEASKEFEAFAAQASTKYPDLQLGKVNYKTNPYLAARFLLTEIPELRLLIKNEGGKWAAYSPAIAEGSEELIDYLDNQNWLDESPIGSQMQLYCSPFNLCGASLAFIAEKVSGLDDLIPLPRWLAMILLPALFAFLGRFIIEGMYAAEGQVRELYYSVRGQQPPSNDDGSDDESEYEDDEGDAAEDTASNAKETKETAKKPKNTKKTQ